MRSFVHLLGYPLAGLFVCSHAQSHKSLNMQSICQRRFSCSPHNFVDDSTDFSHEIYLPSSLFFTQIITRSPSLRTPARVCIVYGPVNVNVTQRVQETFDSIRKQAENKAEQPVQQPKSNRFEFCWLFDASLMHRTCTKIVLYFSFEKKKSCVNAIFASLASLSVLFIPTIS